MAYRPIGGCSSASCCFSQEETKKRALTHLVLVKSLFPLLNLTFRDYFLSKTIVKNVAVVVTCSSYRKHPTVISDYSRIQVQITLFFILLSYLRLTLCFQMLARLVCSSYVKILLSIRVITTGKNKHTLAVSLMHRG